MRALDSYKGMQLVSLCVLSFVLSSYSSTVADPANGAGKASSRGTGNQVVYGLSQKQEFSAALGAWGVPAAVLVGGKRVRGFYVTGLTGQGLSNDLGLASGDVLLNLGGHGLDSAPLADHILAQTKAGNLKASVARVRGNSVSLKNPLISFGGFSFAPKESKKVVMSGEQLSQFRDADDAKDPITETPNIAALESYMFNRVNQDRAANGGLPPLRRSGSLSRVARAFAEDMAKRGFFDHRDPEGRMPKDRARDAGITAPVSENIAWQKNFFAFEKIVDQCEDNMMNEPPNDPNNHRGNILNPRHACMGVGVAVVLPHSVICVQEFSSQDLP
ncbi:MAG: CAP domain-containing protein [Candidatus Obscuribacter sp.]|nr:CAP domain-containing protein [Candidatus Obscuribacter sp.]